MPVSRFAFVRIPRRRFLQIMLFVALIALCGKWLNTAFAQRRMERSAPATKPKSKTKVPAPSRSRQQQQINADGSITGQLWVGEAGITETTSDIMTREQSLRLKSLRRARRETEDEFEQPNREKLPQNPEALPGGQWPPTEIEGLRDRETERSERQANHPAFPLSLARSIVPSPTLNFTAATLAETTAFPPDSMGAAGPTQFLLAVNGRIRVFNKTTGAIGQLDADIDSFFNSVRAGSITTDPRVRYDRLSGRWFILLVNTAQSNNRILLAVSDGSTINTATVWTFYQFAHNEVSPSGDNGCFADYPTLGIDANALYVGLNQFCNRAFTNSTALVIRKSSILSGGQIVVSAFRNLIDATSTSLKNGIFTPQGVDNPAASSSEGYFIGTDAGSLGRLVLRRVSNPGGVPVMSANIYLNVLQTSQPITVRHRGNINSVNGRLDAIDDRLMMAQYRNGSIWTVHNISVNNEGTVDAPRTRDGIRWYEVTDVGTNVPALRQAGTLFTQTTTNTEDERNYFMPSLAVSGQGHVLAGGSTAGTNEYVNAAIAYRLATDPLGVLQSPLLITASGAPYNPSSDSGNQSGRRRWGDYSFTSVDPCDDMTIWTVQQFSDAANSYGLRVARIPAPPPATPAATNPPAISAGLGAVNVTITGIALSDGAGFYDPGDTYNCRLRASVSGGVIVNSVSYVNPTTVQLNLSTVNAAAGVKSVTITNPDGQTATGINILTVGNCAFTVTANNSAFTSSGGVGTVSVETSSVCGWTAISNSNFITINSGAVASGTGTVSFTVAPTTGIARAGAITVAGQVVTINQSAGNGCSYTLTPATKNFPANGGSGSFAVATSSECTWAPTISDSFISVLFSSGNQGNGTINFTVAANTQPIQRTGTITVGGRAFTVTQDAAPFELAVDDGTFETAAGVSTGGTSYRVNRLTPAFYPATINAVSIYFPENNSVRVGDQYSVIVASNADGDANIDGLPFQTTAAQIQQIGAFNVVNIPPLTITSGDFVVGIKLTQVENVFPFALDTTKSKTRSYRSLDGVTFELIDTLGSFGNYGIRARLVRPPKLIIGASSALIAESCLPGNKVIDPGETVTVSLSLGNNGSSATQNLTATLLPSSNVITAEQTRSYGAMIPSSSAVARQFTFTASGACGGNLPVSVSLKDGNEDLGVVTFNFTLGAIGTTTQTFSYAGDAMKIPDGDARGVSLPIVVSGFASNIADLNFRIDGTQCVSNPGATGVGVDHTWVGDLVFRLTSPAGTTVTIISRPGGSGNSGKNFCQTLLDDDAANAISISSIASNGPPPQGPPYTGTFKPANPLSTFDGENPNGTWMLTVIDAFTGDSGSVRAFSLQLTGYTCCQTSCLDVTGLSVSSGAVGTPVTITGSGFSGVSSVKFGDAPATFTVNSNSSISTTVPAGARTSPIVLSKPGCVDAQTLNFTTFPSISMTPSPLTAIAGTTTAVTVNLSYPQTNSVTVTLASTNSTILTIPANVVIPAGSSSAIFHVSGTTVGGPATITATLPANLGGASSSISVNVAARAVSAVNSAGSLGRTVNVPITLDSKGDETAVNFSLSFDTKFLANPRTAIGEDAIGTAVFADATRIAQGILGISITQPSGKTFSAGLRQIVVVTFDVAPTATATTTTINFGDQPITRSVLGGSINITAQFVSGAVRLGQGYEGDVTPRTFGNNNGQVTITDWVQVGRFVAGLDVPVTTSNEFQRADCAPRETLGDGRITLADWVQTGRYVAGLDVPAVAGGPIAFSASLGNCGPGIANCGLKAIRGEKISDPLTLTNKGSVVLVKLKTGGGENALSFSLGFDPSLWRFVSARAGRNARRATVIVNQNDAANGHLGLAIALPSGITLRAGEAEVVVLQFAPHSRTRQPLQPEFTDFPVARSIIDARANTIR